MSKKVKALVERDIKNRVGDAEGVAVISPRGLDGRKNNELRRKLHGVGVHMQVVKNTLAKRAVGSGKLSGFDKLLNGPSALLYGKASIPEIARLLVAAKKDNAALEFRGVFFDGDIYEGEAGMEAASKLPTRTEAIAEVMGALLGGGSSLAGALQGPGSTLGALLSAIEEKAKERGDTVEEAPAATAVEAAAPVADEPKTADEPPASA